ncbi:hypothetical protein [Shewanella waksmanii]|uniref:hypothetical protein n=1 Tax=Shewanella waksmanii TaxID=213783 RepID=UPI003735E09E
MTNIINAVSMIRGYQAGNREESTIKFADLMNGVTKDIDKDQIKSTGDKVESNFADKVVEEFVLEELAKQIKLNKERLEAIYREE